MTQERNLVTTKLGEDGLPVVIVSKHELDTVQVPTNELNEHVVTYDTVWYHHGDELDAVSYLDLKELDEFLPRFEAIKKDFIEKAMATGHYKKVDLVLETNGCQFYAIYYGHPTIEEVVQAKEYHRNQLGNIEHNIKVYTDLLEQSKEFLNKMGD